MKHPLKVALGFAVLISVTGSAFAQEWEQDVAPDWSFTASAGVLASQTYFGDDETQISIFPNLRFEYGERFVIGLGGVEYTALKTENFAAGLVVRYDFGRDEDGSNPFSVSGDETTDLIGLGDIDGTVEVGGFVEYSISNFTAELEARQGVDGHEGLVAEAQVKYNTIFDLVGQPAFLSIGPSISYGDDNYNSTYFDISAAQSIASGLTQYDADGGLNTAGMEATLFRPINEKWSMALFAEYDHLLGDVANSSLVEKRGSESQVTGGLFLNYSF